MFNQMVSPFLFLVRAQASAFVVGPRENQCRDVELESGDGAEHNMSEPLVNSPETKRLKEIAIASGASVRTSYKTVRKRFRIEARRQKELDGGVEPEVVLDSFLNQVKVEQHPRSGQLKRVLTPAAKAAKHRRARDKKFARDSVLVDRQRQGVSRRRSVQLQACGG